MSNYYKLTDQKYIFLYSIEHKLFLRYQMQHNFSQPILLTEDFQSSLFDTTFNSTLYYGYINITGELVVKSILEQIFPVILQPQDDWRFQKLSLTVFQNQLCLFFTVRFEETGLFRCFGMPLYQNQNRFSLPFPDSETLPNFQIFPSKSSCHIFFENENTQKLVKLLPDYSFSDLSSSEKAIRDLLSEKDHSIQKLENRCLDLQQSLSIQEDKNHILSAQLKSASSQYEELMQVANAYREEALKWRSKYKNS